MNIPISIANALRTTAVARRAITQQSARITLAILFCAANVFGQVATDHFKCYNILQAQPPIANVPVQLQDQFSPEGLIPALVGSAFRLCNPVEKTVFDGTPEPEPIVNPNNHLTFYRIQSPEGMLNLQVEVDNQFGVRNLMVTTPFLLAVPTLKQGHAPPANLDHFKCYLVSGQPINAKVGLRDQFQLTSHAVANPVLLCNPTRKIHGGQQFGVAHPDEHLVCYAITRRPFEGARAILNQMLPGAAQQLALGRADLLCVPSKKRIIPEGGEGGAL